MPLTGKELEVAEDRLPLLNVLLHKSLATAELQFSHHGYQTALNVLREQVDFLKVITPTLVGRKFGAWGPLIIALVFTSPLQDQEQLQQLLIELATIMGAAARKYWIPLRDMLSLINIRFEDILKPIVGSTAAATLACASFPRVMAECFMDGCPPDMIAAKGLRLERMLEIGLALHVSSMADKSLEIKSISAFMQQVQHMTGIKPGFPMPCGPQGAAAVTDWLLHEEEAGPNKKPYPEQVTAAADNILHLFESALDAAGCTAAPSNDPSSTPYKLHVSEFLSSLVLSRLVKLSKCLQAVRANKGLAKYRVNKLLQAHVLHTLYEQMSLLDQDHWCPPDLKDDLDLGMLSAMVLVRYIDHLAVDQKPLTEAVADMMRGDAVKMIRASESELAKAAGDWLTTGAGSSDTGPELSSFIPNGPQQPGLAWTMPDRGHPVSARTQMSVQEAAANMALQNETAMKMMNPVLGLDKQESTGPAGSSPAEQGLPDDQEGKQSHQEAATAARQAEEAAARMADELIRAEELEAQQAGQASQAKQAKQRGKKARQKRSKQAAASSAANIQPAASTEQRCSALHGLSSASLEHPLQILQPDPPTPTAQHPAFSSTAECGVIEQSSVMEPASSISAPEGPSEQLASPNSNAGCSPGGEGFAAPAYASAAHPAGQECVVCWCAEASVLFQPCGHACTCSACAPLFLTRDGLCPMCRAPVGGSIMLEC